MNIAEEVAIGFLAADRGFIDQKKLGESICKWLEDAPDRGLCDYFTEIGLLTANQVRDLQGEFLTVIPASGEETDEFQTKDWGAGTGDTQSNAVATKDDHSRFQIIKQYARGGLGVVYLAHDAQLQRDVALKQIRGDRDRDALSETKFLLEAEITGQLEHPGIVPVYALGTDSNGSPYYAMRFIRGQEFKKIIQQFHEARKGTKAGLDGVPFRQLLRRFLDVCNAIEYAHSRGILHRDLKPANIMIGSHGETLVVDWGLAKILARHVESDSAEDCAPEEFKPKRVRFSGTTSDTMQGSFSGTIAYAPPEQLMGLIEELCPASDVYSLGAILFELMTNRIPLSQKPDSLSQVVEWTRDPDFANPRRFDSEIPKSLAMICKKAMTFDIASRYPSARELAVDIERWLADERVIAFGEREPASEMIGRLMRRYRRWTVPIIATILFSTIVAMVGAWLINNARIQELIAKETANQNKNDAVNRIGVARNAIDTLLVGSTESLGDFPAARDLQKRLYEVAANDYSKLSASKSDDPELELERLRALVRVADIQMLQSEYDEGQKNYRIVITELQTRIDKTSSNDRIALSRRVELAKTIGRFAFAIDSLEGMSEESKKQFAIAISQLRALAVAHPKSSEVHVTLGKTLIRAVNSKLMTEKPADALQMIDEALASLTDGDLAQDSALSLLRIQAIQNRAQALGRLNRNDEALATIERSLSLISDFVTNNKAERTWFNAQADSLVIKAGIHRRIGDFKTASQNLVIALETYEQLKKEWTDNLDYRSLAASASANVGLLLLDENRPLDAISFFMTSRDDFSELRKEYPRIERYGDGLGTALSGLGQAELRTNEDAEVPIELLSDSDVLYGALARQQSDSGTIPVVPLAKSAGVRGQLAQAHQRKGNTPEARHWYSESASLFQHLIDIGLENSDYRYALAEVEWRRGQFEWDDEDRAEANRLISSSLDRMRTLVQEHSENSQYHFRLAEILIHSPEVTMEYSREADKQLEIAAELQPANLELKNLWAEVKARISEIELAKKLLAEILANRGSRSARDFGVLAMIDCQSGNREGAIANLSSCRELVTSQQPYDPDLLRWMLSIQQNIDAMQ
ncbi:MAG: protein kinase [Planctomycetota bacterium]|nr:protein kinase [Planctomycetota bacterium]